jgi:SAM-dependent methyltransferase
VSEMRKEGHLGGYLVGGDPDTIYPELWDWLVETWEVKSVIDVGCGDGQALKYFAHRGCKYVLGVEGTSQADSMIVRHDYNTGPYVPDFHFDLAWSCEFVEHVEEQYVPNFMATFQAARFAMITHAEPGQPGWHHVNCKSADYWKGVFAAHGFEFDDSLTGMSRAVASANTRVFNHYRRSGLAFRRTGVVPYR